MVPYLAFMKPQISDREDIKLLIDTFYNQVRADELIGYIFNDISHIDWPKHLPVMYDFWEAMLLHNPVYRGQVIPAHIALDKKTPLNQAHFTRWRELFFSTLDDLFEGEVVEDAKRRVNLMEPLMLFKIEQSRKDGFIQ